MEIKDMDVECPFLVVNPVTNSVEVIETMGLDAVCPSTVVNTSLELWLMYIQPWMEIEDVIVGCPFVVVTHWVRVDVVNFGEMEVI
jgi:hypothetical protein